MDSSGESTTEDRTGRRVSIEDFEILYWGTRRHLGAEAQSRREERQEEKEEKRRTSQDPAVVIVYYGTEAGEDRLPGQLYEDFG